VEAATREGIRAALDARARARTWPGGKSGFPLLCFEEANGDPLALEIAIEHYRQRERERGASVAA
jgi:hypothetical protein